MSVRDRRRLGVNFISVLRAARRLSESPEFEPESDRELHELILEEILSKKLPEARASMPEIDWTAIIAFIERVLPLILKLIAFF